jgi:hypothetical protein
MEEKMRYKKLKSKDLIKLNVKKENLKFACCDCGLIHLFDFTINKDELFISVVRDNRATAQYRRWRKR